MGEGGCDARYFLYEMTPSEARDYVDGLNRRHRQGWEQTRALMGLICKVLTGHALDMPLPWDEEERDARAAADAGEIDALRRRAREVEQRLNAGRAKA